MNLKDYFAHKKKMGVDTEYFRQAEELYWIFVRFLQGYLDCYYATKEDLVRDEELLGAK